MYCCSLLLSDRLFRFVCVRSSKLQCHTLGSHFFRFDSLHCMLQTSYSNSTHKWYTSLNSLLYKVLNYFTYSIFHLFMSKLIMWLILTQIRTHPISTNIQFNHHSIFSYRDFEHILDKYIFGGLRHLSVTLPSHLKLPVTGLNFPVLH